MSGEEQVYPEYHVFKGLQRPLEFFGFRGRYLIWAAAAVAVSLLGFMILYVAVSFLVAIIVSLVSLGIGAVAIFVKQQFGLHSKKVEKGIFVFARLWSIYY